MRKFNRIRQAEVYKDREFSEKLRCLKKDEFMYTGRKLFCSGACKEGGPVSMNLVLVVISRLWICWFRYALCGCAALKQEFREGKDTEMLTALGITDEVPVWSKCCPFCLYTIYTSVIWG